MPKPGRRKAKLKLAAVGPLDAAAAASVGVPTLAGQPGDALTVEVDVTAIVIPYSVIFADRTLIHGRTDQRVSTAALAKGTYALTWAFSHAEKGWSHTLSAQLGAQPAVLLEQKSEAKKDAPASIGLALVVIS